MKKLSRTKADHCTIRNGKMFCTHCGQSTDFNFPVPVDKVVVMLKAFSKEHRKCPKTSEQVDMTLTVGERAKWWLLHGERGLSSEEYTVDHFFTYLKKLITDKFASSPSTTTNSVPQDPPPQTEEHK